MCPVVAVTSVCNRTPLQVGPFQIGKKGSHHSTDLSLQQSPMPEHLFQDALEVRCLRGASEVPQGCLKDALKAVNNQDIRRILL